MKKMFLLMVVLLVVLSGCLPAQSQPETINPTPISEADLQATAAVISQLTLNSLPTATIAPSETPVVMTATETLTQAAPTETPNPVLLTFNCNTRYRYGCGGQRNSCKWNSLAQRGCWSKWYTNNAEHYCKSCV